MSGGEGDGLAVDDDLGRALGHQVEPGERTANAFPVPVGMLSGVTDVQSEKTDLVSRVCHGDRCLMQRKRINHESATHCAFFFMSCAFFLKN